MKLSFAIPEKLECISLEAFEMYVSETAKMGYVAVEPLINDPSTVDVDAILAILDRYQMKISGLRSGPIYAINGWRLSSPDPENRRNAVSRLKDVIALAGKLKTGVMVGLMQGHLEEGERLEDAQDRIVDSLRECAIFAAEQGATIFYEPINRFEMEYHHTVEEIAAMLRRINEGVSRPVKMLVDVYHMHLEEASIPSALIRSMPYIGHVHLCDSNRCAPGMGCIDFAEIIKDLKAMNYPDYLAVEVNAIPSILESAKVSADYLRPLLQIL